MTLMNDAPAHVDTMLAAKDVCVRSMQIMADGTLDEFEELVHPEAYNRESKDEPPATRGRGPEAFYATALWLRSAFDELAFEVHDVVAAGDLAESAHGQTALISSDVAARLGDAMLELSGRRSAASGD